MINEEKTNQTEKMGSENNENRVNSKGSGSIALTERNLTANEFPMLWPRYDRAVENRLKKDRNTLEKILARP